MSLSSNGIFEKLYDLSLSPLCLLQIGSWILKFGQVQVGLYLLVKIVASGMVFLFYGRWLSTVLTSTVELRLAGRCRMKSSCPGDHLRHSSTHPYKHVASLIAVSRFMGGAATTEHHISVYPAS